MCKISYTLRPRTETVVWKKPGLDLYTDLREAPKRQEITLRAPVLVATILGMSFYHKDPAAGNAILGSTLQTVSSRGLPAHQQAGSSPVPQPGLCRQPQGKPTPTSSPTTATMQGTSCSQPGQEPGICLPKCPQSSPHHKRRSHTVHMGAPQEHIPLK